MHRFLVIAAVAVFTLLAAPATGQAADGAELAAFADEVATSWVPHQNAEGVFVDPILGRGSAYGTVMIGYGLLRAGVRRNDPELVQAGIRAFNSRLSKKSQVRSYFQVLPFAQAYVFAKRELASNPLWRQSRPGWERYLRTFARGPFTGGAGKCIADPDCFHNHEAVQKAAEIALLNTGLSSHDRRSPLRNRKAFKRRILRDANRVVPRFIGRSGSLRGPLPLNGIGLLSDSGRWPLSYHGLSTAMYALSLQTLPMRDTRPGRIALRRAARASLGLMAPDGDVTWLGRRGQEAWAITAEMAAGMMAARVAPIPAGERDELRTMARIGFGRLVARHPIGSSGLANTPPIVSENANFARGIQSDPINSNGLVVFLLNLAADHAGTYKTSTIPMDHDGYMIVRKQSAFAAVRHGSVWYAVRHLEPKSDLRNAYGLLALKVNGPAGWRDLIEPRPVPGSGTIAGSTTIGPAIVRGGRRYLPTGLRIKPSEGGAMRIVTRFHAGAKRFTASVLYTPTSDGIVVGLATRATDIVEFTSFHPTPELKLFADGVGDANARMTVPALAGVTRREGFVSCCQPQLTAVTLRVPPGPGNWVSYRVSPASAVEAIGASAFRPPIATHSGAATGRAGASG